jgi:hypothetical protein
VAQSKTDKQIPWYGVDEQTVRWLALIVLVVVELVAAGGAYSQWEARTLERRAAETLERAGGMLSAVREEGGYSLQVSRSRLFADNLIEVDGRLSSSARLGISDEGALYWRVASIDARGERSSWSETRRFRVLSTGGIYWEDQEAPPLELEDIYVNGNIVIVTGRTDPGVNLHVAGQPVPVNADGSFLRPVSVSGVELAGLVATAVDAAGNQTVEYREVFIDEAL